MKHKKEKDRLVMMPSGFIAENVVSNEGSMPSTGVEEEEEHHNNLINMDSISSRRKFILSMRPSSMSEVAAEQILEEIMNDNDEESSPSLLLHDAELSPLPLLSPLPQSSTQRPNNHNYNYNVNDALPAGSLVRSGGYDGTIPIFDVNPTIQEISRDTLAFFDEPFYGLEPENKKQEHKTVQESLANQKANICVDKLSDALRNTYLNETDDVLDMQATALKAEIENLSFNEKHRFMFDVHGMPQMNDGNDTNENQKMEEYLHQLDAELLKITTIGGDSTNVDALRVLETQIRNFNYVNGKDFCLVDAFLEAQLLNPNYVNGKEFRLMFVRRYSNLEDNQFDVRQAAEKLIVHFGVKKMIFGNGEILGRDVRLSDLSKDDIDAMHTGAYQTLPIRDISGRGVVIYAPGQRSYKMIENWLRGLWYMVSLTTRDLENQKVGIVTIFHPDPLSHGTDSYDIISKNLLVMKESFPVNTKALHYCYTNKLMQPLVTAQRVHFLSKNQRCHFREHLSKNHDEICFRLETYGIIIDKEIFLPNGRLGLGWYKEWFQFRAAIERQDELQFQQQQHQQHHNHNQHHKNKNIGTNMIFPRQYDVLFGRAKKNREHTGNLRCAHLVDSHQIEYEEASKLEKTTIADKIVRTILDSNGRFLKMDKQKGWLEVGPKDAREKVSHFFRHRRSLCLSKTTTANNSSTTKTGKGKRPAPA